jgi:putative transcriptional regulator
MSGVTLALTSKQNKFVLRKAARVLLIVASISYAGTTMAAERFLAGQLLVATSEMKDPRFAESIIYLVKHSDEGAFGLIINKPVTKGSFSEVLQAFGVDGKSAKGDIFVHYGGPVSRDQGFVLHSDEIILDSSTKVKDGIAVTADVKIVQMLASGTGPRQALLIMGYSGWGPGQLEMEIKADSWFTIGADKSLIFGKEADKKWRRAMDKRQIPL